MKTIDEMLNLALLSADQHQQISAWIAQANSPEDKERTQPLPHTVRCAISRVLTWYNWSPSFGLCAPAFWRCGVARNSLVMQPTA